MEGRIYKNTEKEQRLLSQEEEMRGESKRHRASRAWWEGDFFICSSPILERFCIWPPASNLHSRKKRMTKKTFHKTFFLFCLYDLRCICNHMMLKLHRPKNALKLWYFIKSRRRGECKWYITFLSSFSWVLDIYAPSCPFFCVIRL